MTGKRKTAIALGVALILAIVGVGSLLIIRHLQPRPQPIPAPVLLTGVVLTDDKDPKKQIPIPNATVVATSPLGQEFRTETDPSGLFRLTVTMSAPSPPNASTSLRVTHPGYEPGDSVVLYPDLIQIVRLVSSAPVSPTPVGRVTSIGQTVRVRYAEQISQVTNVGSLVKTFEVVNKGNVPCEGRMPCSPDGRWKATIGGAVLEGRQETTFRNVRVSCIAGPCPFSKLESEDPIGNSLKINVRNWSDTVTYLVEAEVSQIRTVEAVRDAYAAVFGSSMNFTLPATVEGASIEAEVNGRDIIFPLGPDLTLSWGECSMKMAPDRTKLYHCDLKPGYQFK